MLVLLLFVVCFSWNISILKCNIYITLPIMCDIFDGVIR